MLVNAIGTLLYKNKYVCVIANKYIMYHVQDSICFGLSYLMKFIPKTRYVH